MAQVQQVSFLTQDHLGSPRVITNETGAVTSRQDFSAFGDETLTVQRTHALGYKPDELRKDYTGYEKDDETGLEFAQARYYNPKHGRFTSVDPLTASANVKDPQTFNRYSYALNSPYKFTDPLGLISQDTGACGEDCANSGGTPFYSGFQDASSNFLKQEQKPKRKKRATNRKRTSKTKHSAKQPADLQPMTPGPSAIPKSNGVADDIATDSKLARLLGNAEQSPTVTGANQAGTTYVGLHYLLDDGTLYTIHISGPTGNEDIEVFLPAGFAKPVLTENANPDANGKYGLVSTNSETGEVLAFAHVDSIQSQADLDKTWALNKTNQEGSRYIGNLRPCATCSAGGSPGNSGGGPGNVHAHITLYSSFEARETVRRLKYATNDIRDPKYFRDLRSLVK